MHAVEFSMDIDNYKHVYTSIVSNTWACSTEAFIDMHNNHNYTVNLRVDTNRLYILASTHAEFDERLQFEI